MRGNLHPRHLLQVGPVLLDDLLRRGDPEIVPVLSRLDTSEQALSFIGKILSAFDREQVADLPGSLSKREHEVLTLLSRRLSNKEIGERLYISPATVKRHTHNIYEKLRVKDRREAVAKAGGLGLLP